MPGSNNLFMKSDNTGTGISHHVMCYKKSGSFLQNKKIRLFFFKTKKSGSLSATEIRLFLLLEQSHVDITHLTIGSKKR